MTSPWPVGTVTLLVMFTVALVMLESVIGEMETVDASSIETSCLGVWECGGPSLLAIAGAVGLLMVLVGTIVLGLRGRLPRP